MNSSLFRNTTVVSQNCLYSNTKFGVRNVVKISNSTEKCENKVINFKTQTKTENKTKVTEKS